MNIAITGSRSEKNYDFVASALDGNVKNDDVLLFGDAGGVDAHARRYAITRGLRFQRFEADWATHGRAAGPIRNQAMLSSCAVDLLLAFPGGNGTHDCCQRARAMKIPVQFCNPQEK